MVVMAVLCAMALMAVMNLMTGMIDVCNISMPVMALLIIMSEIQNKKSLTVNSYILIENMTH